MCGRVGVHGRSLSPGTRFSFITQSGIMNGSWGIGPATNARSENIETTWKYLAENKGVLPVDSFYEKEGLFIHPDYHPMDLAILFRESDQLGCEFVILTQQAIDPVLSVHHRMPILIGDRNQWLRSGIIVPSTLSLLRAA